MKIRSSYLWAGLVALGVVGWMVSDDLLRPQADDAGVEISSSDVNAIDAPRMMATQCCHPAACIRGA